MRISDWSSDVCSSDLWKAGGEIRPTEGVSRAKEETHRRSKLSGFVTEGVMEKGADFGILSRSPLMKASGMSDTDDSQTEIEAIDARLPLAAWNSERGNRKNGGWGKSESEPVNLGGSRYPKKKK